MRVDEMISRATHTSGRTLLAVSTLVVASSIFDFDLKSLPLFNHGEIPEPTLQKIALWLILFLTLAHILNWVNDLNGYLLNDKKKMAKDPDELHNWLRDGWAKYEQSATESGSPDSGPLNGDRFVKHLSRYDQSNMKVLWKKSDWSEKVALLGQHLAFPVGLSLWAFYILFKTIFLEVPT